MPSNRIVYGASYWDFISIRGLPALPSEQTKTIVKAGVNGYAFKSQGWLAEPAALTLTSLAANASVLASLFVDYSELQKKQVTLWDPHGQYYTGIFLDRIKIDRAQRQLLSVWFGTSYVNAWIVTTSMTVIFPYGSY